MKTKVETYVKELMAAGRCKETARRHETILTRFFEKYEKLTPENIEDALDTIFVEDHRKNHVRPKSVLTLYERWLAGGEVQATGAKKNAGFYRPANCARDCVHAYMGKCLYDSSIFFEGHIGGKNCDAFEIYQSFAEIENEKRNQKRDWLSGKMVDYADSHSMRYVE